MTQIGPDAKAATRINALTEQIIGCAFMVGTALGRGYLEKVYENALAHELRKAGLAVEQQKRLDVWYDGILVGEFAADLLVEDLIVVELKAARAIDAAHEGQCLNYLAATKLPVCLLLNFWTRVEVRRIVGPSAPAFPTVESKPSDMTWAEWAETGEHDLGP